MPDGKSKITFFSVCLLFTENADSSTIHAVTYLRNTEILTVNSIGQLKLWDIRQQQLTIPDSFAVRFLQF